MENKWAGVDNDLNNDEGADEENPEFLASIAQLKVATPTKPQSNHSQDGATQSDSAQHQPRPQQSNQQKAFQESQQQNVFCNQQMLDGSGLDGYLGSFPVENSQGDMHQRLAMLSRGPFNNQNNQSHKRYQNKMNAPGISRPLNGYNQGRFNSQPRILGHFRIIDGNEANKETLAMCIYNPMHLYKTSEIRIHESMCPDRPRDQQSGSANRRGI